MSSSLRRPAVVAASRQGLIAVVGFGSIAFAAVAGDSKAKQVKVKCPAQSGGKKVTCTVVGKLPKGPKGPKGAKGPAGVQGAPGAPGLPGYEIVSATFKEVYIENSGGMAAAPRSTSAPTRSA